MKRILTVFLILTVMLLVCGCYYTDVNTNAKVQLNFAYAEENICVVLPDAEAQRIAAILDGKHYDSVLSGVPACGFDRNVSLEVGGRVFAIACDTCNNVQDMGNLRYFEIPKEDMEYIHSVFEQYGGYFPCV